MSLPSYIRNGSEYLDQLTGVKGVAGYLIIVVLVVIGHMWANHVPQHVLNHHPKHGGKNQDEEEEEEDLPRNFTLKQLAYYNGKVPSSDDSHTKATTTGGGEGGGRKMDDPKPVYLALNGVVFDVSSGRDFYGPGGPYEMFAGRECGLALARMSFDQSNLDVIDDSVFTPGERMELIQWMDKFQYYRRYPIKGKVLNDKMLPDPHRIITKEQLAMHDGRQQQRPSKDDDDDNGNENIDDWKSRGYATAPIYIGAGNKVFDVSFGGVEFYGPGRPSPSSSSSSTTTVADPIAKDSSDSTTDDTTTTTTAPTPYGRFAGKDVTRALAKMSLKEEDIDHPELLDDLTESQWKALKDWIHTYEVRKMYPIVGRLDKDDLDEKLDTTTKTTEEKGTNDKDEVK